MQGINSFTGGAGGLGSANQGEGFSQGLSVGEGGILRPSESVRRLVENLAGKIDPDAVKTPPTSPLAKLEGTRGGGESASHDQVRAALNLQGPSISALA